MWRRTPKPTPQMPPRPADAMTWNCLPTVPLRLKSRWIVACQVRSGQYRAPRRRTDIGNASLLLRLRLEFVERRLGGVADALVVVLQRGLEGRFGDFGRRTDAAQQIDGVGAEQRVGVGQRTHAAPPARAR